MIERNDQIKWRLGSIGFSRGQVLEIIDDDTLKVIIGGYKAYGRGLSKAGTYTIKKSRIVEVNGEPYGQDSDEGKH